MARDDSAPGVEFNGGPDDGDPEEELLSRPLRRFRPTQRWTLAGGGAVLVLAALLTRGLSHPNNPRAAATSASLSASAPAASGTACPKPSTVSGGVAMSGACYGSGGSPVQLPEGNRTGHNFCPDQPGCTLVRTLPPEAVQAINGAFRDAVVHTTTSIIGPSANRIAPELIDRAVAVEADAVTVTIHIALSGGHDRQAHREVHAATSRTTVRHLTQGYTIDITATRRGAPVPTATLTKLATDVGLLTPE